MRMLLTFAFILLFGVGAKAQIIYRINTTDDTDDGVCNNAHCSLREAIRAANTDGIGSILWFELTGGGTKVITLDSELPPITESKLSIHGTTLINNYPTKGLLVIDGNHLIDNGFRVQATDVRIYGLQLQNFVENAILIKNPTQDTISQVTIGDRKEGNIFVNNGTAVRAEEVNRLIFQGNFVGTNTNFEQGLGNKSGIIVSNNLTSYEDAQLVIGGSIDYALQNYFVNCSEAAIDLSYHGSGKIEGNIFGTDKSGQTELGNNIAVQMGHGRGRIDIGGSEDTKNIFAYNQNAVIVNDNNFVRVSENSFYCNSMGLLVTENALPSPIIETGKETLITGIAQPNDFVELYVTDYQTCNSSDCQGMTYLGGVRADANGKWQMDGDFKIGQQIVALSLNAGRQSNFSACFRLCPPPIQSLATNEGPFCADDTLKLAAETDLSSFTAFTEFPEDRVVNEWTGPNGYFAEGRTPMNAIEAGDYILQTYLFGCPSLPDTTEVIINFIEAAIKEVPTFCQENAIQLNSMVHSNAEGLSYQWTGPNGYVSFVPNPSDVQASGTYHLTVKGENCASKSDSIEVINHFPPEFSFGDLLQVCEGESVNLAVGGYEIYDWSGDFVVSCDTCDAIAFTPTTDGTISLNAGPTSDCQISASLKVELVQAIHNTEKIALCPSSSLFLFSKEIDQPGTYEKTFTGHNGCDSTQTYIVTPAEEKITYENQIICEGTAFDKYTSSGIYENHFTASNGCDSTHVLELTILESTSTAEHFTLCAGEVLAVFDTVISSNFSLEKTFTAANGCDSVHAITVLVNETFEQYEQITLCAGEETTLFNDLKVDETGAYEKHFIASNGCDSIVMVDVTILAPIETFSTLTICNNSLEDTNTPPQDYAETYTAQSGCDSIHYVSFSILESKVVEETITICANETYAINGIEVAATGQYKNSYTGQNGCDSLHITHLIVLDLQNTAETVEICEGESTSIFGKEISEAGNYSETYSNFRGCDSTHSIQVLVHEKSFTEAEMTICEGTTIEVFDKIVSDATILSKTFSNVKGCDSTHTITVKILSTVETEEIITICEGSEIAVFDERITTENELSKTFTGANGCDSTHTIKVKVLPTLKTEASIDVCAAACIELYGATACSDKVLQTTFTAVTGCDSVHTLHLNTVEQVAVTKEYYLCAGDSIDVFGSIIKESGHFSETFSSQFGCDSQHTVILNFLEPIVTQIEAQPTCPSETNGRVSIQVQGGMSPYQVKWDGHEVDAQQAMDNLKEGEYLLTVQDFIGCQYQQMITIEAVTPPTIEKDMLEITCYGANDGSILLLSDQNLTYSLNGQAFTTEGQFTNLPPNDYLVTTQDEFGCTYSEAFTLTEPEKLDVQLPETATINLGSSLQLEPTLSNYENMTYEWSEQKNISCTDCQQPIVTPTKNTKYTLTVYDENHCESTAEIWVKVLLDRGIYIPNTFSPNNDGNNDIFTILSAEGPVQQVNDFKVFDRWGNLVHRASDFMPNDENYGWNGYYRGEIMGNGVYLYYAEIEFLDGTKEVFKGDVTLSR